jgi:hypothetical protein
VPAGTGQSTTLRLIGQVRFPAPLDVTVDVWWLQQYGGGLFLPLRGGTAGDAACGGGPYASTPPRASARGGTASTLLIDLNFLNHPSCPYNHRWQCPLAPAGNTPAASVRAGERLSHTRPQPGARPA